MSWPWSQLGLPGPSDLSQVRHAYAEKLKITHPEDDPEGFQRLHSAYQLASRMARQQKRQGTGSPVRAEERPAPPGPEAREREDFDYDQLLQEEGERPRRSRKEEPEETDFDYDELLQEGGETPRRSREQPEDEEKQDFDYDRLLRDGENVPPAPKRPPKQDFDYERLFAEGEAERAEARRRRGEERRKAQERERQERLQREQERRNSYEQDRRDRFDREQAQWQNTETILHTIEMMCNSQVDRAAWEKFFQSPLFQQMKGSLDLIFGLEDMVSTRPDFSQGGRVALFLACGFDKGVSRPELRPLFQMLLPAWKAEQNDKSRQRMHNVFGGIGGVVGVVVIGMILTSSYLPGFIILGILALMGLKRGWFKRSPKTLNRKKLGMWALGVVICAAAAAVTVLPKMWNRVEVMLPASDPREQVCRYLEQDYGEEFRSLYSKNSPDERYSNVFSLRNETSKMFLAGPDGKRDRKNGTLGYTTNYPEMMVRWSLEDFAKQRDIYTVKEVDRGQSLERWETSGTYLISLGFYGDGEVITDLGALLEEMAQTDWYQVRTPEFEIVLCSGSLKEGRLVLFRYKPSDGAFDAEEVRTLYEEDFAHAYCAQLLRDNELDRDFIRDGTEVYTLTGGGMAELKGEECCKLYGLDEKGNVALEYYVSTTGGSVYCVPGDFWEKGGREDSVQFYRLIHVDATGGLLHLFYPWVTVY